MAEDIGVTSHAETNFDPEEYLEKVNRQICSGDVRRKYVIDQLHEIYCHGTITGNRLLDLGTGPCCYSVFAASKWFREIVLSDLSEPNLAVLRDWKAGKRQDQEHLFKYMLELEGSQADWATSSNLLAERVRSVVRADMCSGDMLKGTDAEGLQFDAVNIVLSQSLAAITLAGQKQIVANYSRLLTPGGHLVIVDSVAGPYYQVGNTKFKVAGITMEQFRSAVEESGYQTLYWKKQDFGCDARHVFALVARKQ